MNTRRLTIALVVTLLCIANPAVASPSGLSDDEPVLAYASGEGTGATATIDGTVVQTFDRINASISISQGIVVVERLVLPRGATDLLGLDAATGQTRFRIRDGALPLITGDGAAVVFLPDATSESLLERDVYGNSVWYREVATGEERNLAQFPGSDFDAPQHLGAAPNGRMVAFAKGNEFGSDLWVARTGRPLVYQLTDNRGSANPSFSPDSTTIAYGYRKGIDVCTTEIRTVRVWGTGHRTILRGSCSLQLYRPVWVDTDNLVVWVWGRDGPLGLGTVTVSSRRLVMAVRAPIVDFSVSRSLQKVAFRVDDWRIGVWDLQGGSVTMLPIGPEVPGPKIAIEGAWETS